MNKTAKLLITVVISLLLLGSGMSLSDLFSIQETIPQLEQSVKQPTLGSEATNSAVAGVEGQTAQVVKIVDGDTITVLIGNQEYTVRYIGINTPETKDPRRPVECFGKEASNKNKELLEGKQVILQKDISETDKFGRLLRYIFLPLEDGQILFVNDYLVREGYATSSSYPPDIKYQERFQVAEKAAQQNQVGLWKSCK